MKRRTDIEKKNPNDDCWDGFADGCRGSKCAMMMILLCTAAECFRVPKKT